jgi:hypothetical protein
MKKATIFSAAALLLTSLSTAVVAQPGGYRNGNYPAQRDGYYRSGSPSAPVIILDGEGRSQDVRSYHFNRWEAQQAFDRRQRKRLERRYGFVPPLVMYVPDRYVNRIGDYVYSGGLVYHRGRDGFFHLDNRYYNDRWDDYSYDGRNDGRRGNDYSRY